MNKPLRHAGAMMLCAAMLGVSVAAAGPTISVRQAFRGTPSLGVTCSTGRFLFDNVEVQ